MSERHRDHLSPDGQATARVHRLLAKTRVLALRQRESRVQWNSQSALMVELVR